MAEFPINEEVLVGNETAQRYLAGCPHYHLVPKTQAENLRYRQKLLIGCAGNEVARERVLRMCEEDALFFIASFCYLVEPRAGEEVVGMVPFIPWAHQEPVIAAMWQTMGDRHCVGKKSRAQGASWIALCLLLHAFLFREHCFLGMGSKTQGDSDDPNDPKSLGWKFDFLMANLPVWMRPPDIGVTERNRMVSKHTWKNVTKNNYLKAESATEGIARGGRFFCFALDEAAFFPAGKDSEAVHNLLETTNSVWLISTPNGTSNEFYARATKPGVWLTTNLMWWDNPVQKRGLYTTHKGHLRILDEQYKFPENYKFVLDGKKRSPWYDKKCLDHDNNELLIAQELDGSFTGSVGRPFEQQLCDRVADYTRAPVIRGTFQYDLTDLHSGSFLPAPGGELALWRPLDARYKMPAGQYVLGCDIAAGTAGDTSSNSVISIWDGRTCEQVGEWHSNSVPPSEFAELVVAMCFWLHDGSPTLPFINWENNGSTGTVFTNRMITLAYPNVYKMTTSTDQFYAKKSQKLGFFNKGVHLVLAPLRNALHTGRCTLRSQDCLRELSEYVYDSGNKWVHPGSLNPRDASSAGYNHGDRAIAAAIAVIGLKDQGHLVYDTPMSQLREDSDSVPKNSMAGRWQAFMDRKKTRNTSKSCVW